MSENVGSIHYDLGLDKRKFDRAIDGVNRQLSDMSSTLVNTGKRVAQFAGVMVAAGAAIGLKTNAELETANLQFETLMGSAEKAEEHVRSLFDFAKKTPFETQPIITASRHLLTFGGAALNTQKNLTLVGDAAAATSQNIDEVAFWVGRAYNMIEAGKPFGEAALRLQEMGVLSSLARTRMEELQESGADARTVFNVMTKDLSRFDQAMLKQAETAGGLISTLKDLIKLDLGYVFEPLFASSKRALKSLLQFSETDAWQAIKENARDGVGVVAGQINKLIEAFESGGLQGAMDHVRKTFQDIDFSGSVKNIFGDINFSEMLINMVNKLAETVTTVDWQAFTRNLTIVLTAILTGINWAQITAALVPIFPVVVEQIMSGFIEGIIQWVKNDPLGFAVTIALLLFAPAKWVGAIGKALSKIPLVGTLFSWIFRAIAFLPQKLGAGIRTAAGSIAEKLMFNLRFSMGVHWIRVTEWLKGIGGRVVVAVGDLSKVLWAKGKDVLWSLWGGMKWFWNNTLGKWLGDIPVNIKNKIGDMKNLLVDAGKSIFTGLLDGMKKAWETSKEWLSGIGDKIKNLKGPIEKDRVLLNDEGFAIMQGLEVGLMSGFERVKRSLQGVTQDIGNVEMTPPTATQTVQQGDTINLTINANGMVARSTRDLRDLINEGIALVNQERRAMGKAEI